MDLDWLGREASLVKRASSSLLLRERGDNVDEEEEEEDDVDEGLPWSDPSALPGDLTVPLGCEG